MKLARLDIERVIGSDPLAIEAIWNALFDSDRHEIDVYRS